MAIAAAPSATPPGRHLPPGPNGRGQRSVSVSPPFAQLDAGKDGPQVDAPIASARAWFKPGNQGGLAAAIACGQLGVGSISRTSMRGPYFICGHVLLISTA